MINHHKILLIFFECFWLAESRERNERKKTQATTIIITITTETATATAITYGQTYRKKLNNFTFTFCVLVTHGQREPKKSMTHSTIHKTHHEIYLCMYYWHTLCTPTKKKYLFIFIYFCYISALSHGIF